VAGEGGALAGEGRALAAEGRYLVPAKQIVSLQRSVLKIESS
jgi:hypothetical protein